MKDRYLTPLNIYLAKGFVKFLLTFFKSKFNQKLDWLLADFQPL